MEYRKIDNPINAALELLENNQVTSIVLLTGESSDPRIEHSQQTYSLRRKCVYICDFTIRMEDQVELFLFRVGKVSNDSYIFSSTPFPYEQLKTKLSRVSRYRL
jgi:hypothetical protein